MQRTNNSFLILTLRSNSTFTGFLTLAFLFFGFLGIINHEMWGDELQAWLIARDSLSIFDLFKNLRYESHPGLWHVCLYLITRFTHNPVAMQLFHLLLATVVIYIFARFSPFTRLQKVLFSFGYFPFYEYCIISRNYGIGLLLVFSFCTLFPTRNKSYLLLAGILFFLANTNVYGLFIAIALGLSLLFECILNKTRLQVTASKWDLTISIIIVLFGIVISVLQIIPPPDSSLAAGWTTELNIERLQESILTIWRSYVPIPNFCKYNFWNTNILLQDNPTLNQICLVFSLGLFIFAIGLFVQKPFVLFLYVSGTLGILLFEYLKFIGWIRHYGNLFILFVACLWISSYYVPLDLSIGSIKSQSPHFYRISWIATDFFKKYRNKFVTLLLCTHVAAGTFAFTMDLYNPFCLSKKVARFIQTHHLDNIPIVGTKYGVATALSGYLDRKIYYPNLNKFGSFVVWNKESAKSIDSQELLEKISKLTTQLNSDILLASADESKGSRPGISVLPLAKFTAESIGSNFEKSYLYLIRHKSKS